MTAVQGAIAAVAVVASLLALVGWAFALLTLRDLRKVAVTAHETVATWKRVHELDQQTMHLRQQEYHDLRKAAQDLLVCLDLKETGRVLTNAVELLRLHTENGPPEKGNASADNSA